MDLVIDDGVDDFVESGLDVDDGKVEDDDDDDGNRVEGVDDFGVDDVDDGVENVVVDDPPGRT